MLTQAITTRVPPLATVRRRLPEGDPLDVEFVLVREWQRLGLTQQVQDRHIAIGIGSRGVAEIAVIARTLVALVRTSGGHPFIVPAMGSHGGATPAGQIDVLAGLGVTEASAGCPIRATMDTVIIGETESGFPLHLDHNVAEADGFIIANRIKIRGVFNICVTRGNFYGKSEDCLLLYSLSERDVFGRHPPRSIQNSKSRPLISQNSLLKLTLRKAKVQLSFRRSDDAHWLCASFHPGSKARTTARCPPRGWL